MSLAHTSPSVILSPADRPRANGSIWLIGFALFGVLRLVVAGLGPIVADEAVYWSWSRHLAWGYLDHPPMVAFLIRIGCEIFGNTPVGVRFFSPLMAVGTVAIAVWIARWLLAIPLCQALWVTALLLLSPLVSVLATVITPDTPAIFLSLGVLGCVIAGVQSDRPVGWWLAAGLIQGLALIAKYTTVLLPASVFLAFLTTRAGWKELCRPWPYLSAVIAIAVFSPVIGWNASHEWVSFRFQLNHGLAAGGESATPTAPVGLLQALLYIGDYVGGQFMVWNPVLMILAVLAVVSNVRRYRTLSLGHQLLIWSAIVPPVFFGLASLRAKGQPNWPAMAYFPLAILTVQYVFDSATTKPRAWLKVGMATSIVFMLAVSFPAVIVKAGIRPSKFDELSGWDRFASALEVARDGRPVVCDNARDGGQIAFNLPFQPQVWVYAGGTKPTSFAYMADRPDPRAFAQLAYVGEHADTFCQQFGFIQDSRKTLKAKLETGRTRYRSMSLLTRVPLPPASQPATEPKGN